MNLIDTVLYRPLKSGAVYEGLIPNQTGQKHQLDKKSDNSTTFDTLRYMAQWSDTYAYQMKRIAPLLKGRTLQETVNNIYQFLYNHFQYKLDGSMQNLYSPSAAWHNRKTGFDCKTYSLLAGTILKNLNIDFAYRMVQQAGIMPGQWSHVYVIVPNGSSYYVIDATTHTNKEVQFTKKHDYNMIHQGLASPYTKTAGLGCACQGKPLSQHGLGNPARLNNTVANFHSFLNELENRGVSKQVTDRMLELVKINVQQGIDPNMHEIATKAIMQTSQLGFSLSSFAGITTPSAPSFSTNSMFSLPSTGFNPATPFASPTTTSSGGFGSLVSGAGSFLNNVSVGGVKVGNAVSAVTGLISGNPLAALSLLKDVLPIDKTFGAVFANGFRLNCWGSNETPAITKVWAETDIPKAYAETIGRGINQENLDNYLMTMGWLIARAKFWGDKAKNKCSKDGIYGYGDAAKKAQDQVLSELRKIAPLTSAGIINVPAGQNIPFKSVKDVFNHREMAWSFERLMLPPPAPASATESNPAPAKKESSSTPLLLGAALLAAKLLI